MKRGRTLITGFLMILLAGSLAVQGRGLAAPQTVIVSPHGPYTSLSQALNAARAGDTIAVHGGVYAGPLVITKQITLLGYDWPRIEGNGRGTVVTLAAPGIVVKGFVIRNSGKSLDQENAGIAVEAPAAVIENNRLEETLFGIYLRKAHHSRIRHNVIQSKALPLPRRGDAIRVWYSQGVVIEGNVVEKGRDVVLWYSNNLTVRNNVVSEGRYGLHFMYCDDALIAGNRLLANSVGAFLMYSRRLHLRQNIITANRGSSGYGVGLKDMDDAVIAENLFLNNRVGAFVDNSPREITSTTRFQGNVFAFNDIGITMLPSVRRNHLTQNSFINNTEQVKI
ncbi:MAG: nitrous oxide reductase family maturation protein NosD, partial [Nitrospinota bacterium]